MWTKRQLVDKVFAELALAGYVYDIDPEEQQDAASTLEMMVAGWIPDGISLPFNFAADSSSIDLDADSGVPLVHIRTVYCGAAIAFASSKGKTVRAQTQKAFGDGYSRLLRAAAMPPEQQLRTMPIGAGAQSWRTTDNPFTTSPDTSPLQVGEDGGLNLGA